VAPDLPIHLVSPLQRGKSAKVRALGEHLAVALQEVERATV
jgi:hypothetical protein